ncbi:MAG TPA: CARDB domain-containing protein, partial [Lacipirellulaceae bacterium]|nr:CARDB domain-containing protein [Lacipirellulaceae bacterium]
WGVLGKSGQPTQRKKANELDAVIASIAKRASLAVIDLGQKNAANLAVTRFSTSNSAITTERDIGFDATLHNFGPDARRQCRVELLVDDAPVGEQSVDVPAGGDTSVHFVQRFAAAGSHAVTVRASGDRLDIDNSRSLVVLVRKELRVLCIAGRQGAAKYLTAALNPIPAGTSPISAVTITDGDLADTQLASFDCVFLCNVAQLTANEAERLKRYAEAGGGVVFFLGDRVVPDSYNTFAPSPNSTIRGHGPNGDPRPDIASRSNDADETLLPARIGPLVAERQFGLDPLDYRHPIVAPFRGRERAGLLTTPVSRYYRLDVSHARQGVEVALATRSGDPFIVTASLGRGRIALVATAASLSSVDPASGEPWTTWPTWPSYLPVVRELLSYADSGQREHWEQLVGTPLWGVIRDLSSRRTGSPDLKIVRPDGREAPVALQSTPAGWEWNYADTDVRGIYSLRGLPNENTSQFAVNVDTTESDLTKIDRRDLLSEFQVHSNAYATASSNHIATMSQSAWSPSILWAALALLFTESFMAWQFGRGAV